MCEMLDECSLSGPVKTTPHGGYLGRDPIDVTKLKTTEALAFTRICVPRKSSAIWYTMYVSCEKRALPVLSSFSN